MSAGCPFITCAIKKKGVEFCWDCEENKTCMKWANHRQAGKKYDSFKCYQKLEEDIAFIQNKGINDFIKLQSAREALLKQMLKEFNEGRSKSYYCIAATIMDVEELKAALKKAGRNSTGMEIKEKSAELHSILDETDSSKKYYLKLRK